ncbi:adenosine kinase-like [Dendroctonus ponderosae]
MENESLKKNTLLGLGNPLLDISAIVEQEFLIKYELKPNDAILADAEKHKNLYAELVEKYKTEYIAGGSVQNALRVCQWLIGKPSVTTFFGCVGEDNYSKVLNQRAVSEGVNARYQYTGAEPTGTCAVLVTGHHRSLCANLGAANCFTIDHILLPDNKKLVNTARFYYISGFFLTVSPPSIMEVANVALANDRPLAMNLSAPFISQFYKEPLMQVLPYVDVLFGNETEAETFAQEQDFGTKDIKEIAIKLCNMPKQNEKRSRVVVLTQGVHPVILAHNGKIKEFPVKVLPADQLVDTNGAGDAFAGGFLSQYIQGRDLTVSIKCGMWAARQIVQRSGCTFDGKANFDPAEE